MNFLETVNPKKNYIRCLSKATEQISRLLHDDRKDLDERKIHSVKSILYAAIERAGMDAERSLSTQCLLRRLLWFAMIQTEASDPERQEALKILEELKKLCLF